MNKFTSIKNDIDERITIFMHDQSGYYNVTKTATLVTRLIEDEDDEEDVDEESRQHSKRVSDWIQNKSTMKLFRCCSKLTNIEVDELKIEIIDGKAPTRGTYIHPMLYDNFLVWLDSSYALIISAILKSFHADANKKILADKDNKIDQLKREIAELNEESKNTIDEVNETEEANKSCVSEKKAPAKKKVSSSTKKVSTKQSDSDDTKTSDYYGALMVQNVTDPSEYNTQFKKGKKKYVTKQLNGSDEGTIAIETFYSESGVDLRRDVHNVFVQKRKELVDELNKKNALSDTLHNAALKQEIAQYNRDHALAKRVYVNEKKSTPKVKVNDISVKFTKLTFSYKINPYITYDDVIEMIKDVYGINQTSSVNSEDEEDDEDDE